MFTLFCFFRFISSTNAFYHVKTCRTFTRRTWIYEVFKSLPYLWCQNLSTYLSILLNSIPQKNTYRRDAFSNSSTLNTNWSKFSKFQRCLQVVSKMLRNMKQLTQAIIYCDKKFNPSIIFLYFMWLMFYVI